MKFIKSIYLLTLSCLFTGIFAQDYKIICVFGPHEKKVKYDYVMQKSFYTLFKELIKFADKKVANMAFTTSKFASIESDFNKYNVETQANKLFEFLKGKITTKTEKIMFIALGKGQLVVQKALEKLALEFDEEKVNALVDSWQEVFVNNLFKKINISKNNDLYFVKELIEGYANANPVLAVNFNDLKTKAREFYNLLKKLGNTVDSITDIFKN
ncbi:MAG: hypothetical protein SZ59_C0002G0024 [candidate division TM6 bacterium GW2011_GWF2_28_16]|nr:MAG: hypothetical protein SZ59_C0002G0024 [candidate division TM6 bacterium GW2011_GWF2_28_16]